MVRTRTRGLVLGLVTLGAMFAATEVASSQTPATRRIVVSLRDRKLALLLNGKSVRIFPVAVGAPASPSPVGRFTIVNRLTDPTYYRPGKVIGPGPANPLGTRWLGFDRPGYGIHGTDEPRSIGYARSHGCIRLRNSDVEQLFALVRSGDVVDLVDEPTPEIARIFTTSEPGAPAATPLVIASLDTPASARSGKE
jgi:lipoprotein-anchoring transpeptidase ErfK/SrfK